MDSKVSSRPGYRFSDCLQLFNPLPAVFEVSYHLNMFLNGSGLVEVAHNPPNLSSFNAFTMTR